LRLRVPAASIGRCRGRYGKTWIVRDRTLIADAVTGETAQSTDLQDDRNSYPRVMDPAPWLRASDADREAIVAHLSAAAVDGRLTLDEFTDRTQRVYAAHTWGELAQLVGDLPALPTTNAMVTMNAPPTTGSGSRLPLITMILGLVSIPANSCVPLGGVVGVAAIVLGVLGLRTAARGTQGGRVMALAGLIFGSFGVLMSAAIIAYMAFVAPPGA
jgi:hypothetical protein